MPAARSVASVRGMPRPGDTAAASAKVASTNIGRAAFVIVSPCGLPHRGQLVKTRRVRRHAEGVTAANLSGVLPVPEIAQNTGLRETEFGPLNPDVLGALSKIEYAQVLGAGIRADGRRPGRPGHSQPGGQLGPALGPPVAHLAADAAAVPARAHLITWAAAPSG